MAMFIIISKQFQNLQQTFTLLTLYLEDLFDGLSRHHTYPWHDMGPGFLSQDVDLESLFYVTARPLQRDGNAATHELALLTYLLLQ